jgi:hypothetical protein
MTLDLFDDRYGPGSYRTLLTLLRQPCVSFAAIAAQFGVTRERVRQWHRDLLPGAPTGHARQRLCTQQHQRRRLLQDPLVRAFFRHARPHFASGRIEPIRSRQGYRTRTILIDKRVVRLRDIHERARYHGTGDFVYVRLSDDDFLFAPHAAFALLSRLDRTTHALPYKNSFAALGDAMSRTRDSERIDSLQSAGPRDSGSYEERQ